MARSLSNAKLLGDGLSLSFYRFVYWRGYAAAAGAVTGMASSGRGGWSSSGMMGKVEDRAGTKEDSAAAYSAWAPDPVTGYYRPANYVAEIDPAELREMLLNHRVRQQ